MKSAALALCACIALPAAPGCGGGSGSGRAASVAAASAGTGSPPSSSGASAAQWQVALAALGPAYAPATPGFDDAALARWNALLSGSWPALRTIVDPLLDAPIRQMVAGLAASGGTGIQILSVKSVTIDTAAPAAFTSGPANRIVIHAPAAPGAWAIAVTAEVGTTIQQTIAGVPLTIPIVIEVTAHLDGIQVVAPLDFDVTNPSRPDLAGVGAPQIAMRLSIDSNDPLVSQVAGAITQALDPIVRTALAAAPQLLVSQLGSALAGSGGAPWGLGGPALTQVPTPTALEPLAQEISDEIQRHHIPFGLTVLPVIFDQPGYGNGQPDHYIDFGDSAMWTGSYVASEALRYDLTGDARALAGATRALDGLEALLDVGGPGNGLLARCAIPLASPFITAINGSAEYYTGAHHGVPIGGFSEISRDQYIGAVLGASQAMLRVPQLRAVAASNITRMVTYLDANGWIAYFHNQPAALSAEFTPAVDVIWAFLGAATIADPATWGPLRAINHDLARVMWLPVWTSTRDLNEFYKYNLLHHTITILTSVETDPASYREALKVVEIAHDAVGHHRNGWFDAVYGIAIPSAAPAMAALVKSELEHWALRDRRCHRADLMQDPSIARVFVPATTLAGGRWDATTPIPIERRPCGDFIWQSSPFQVEEGATDPLLQEPGIDLVLPYWAARSFGLIR